MIGRALLPLLALLALGVAGAQAPEEEALEQAFTVFQGGQIYCKVDVWQDHPLRSLCFAEKNVLYYEPVDVTLATRIDLAPSFAITPLLQVSYTQEQWWLQGQFGRTVVGHGGFYFSIAGGFPLP